MFARKRVSHIVIMLFNLQVTLVNLHISPGGVHGITPACIFTCYISADFLGIRV